MADRELRLAGSVALDVDDRWQASDLREPWTLKGGGSVALARHLAGTRDYPDLRRSASPLKLDERTTVSVAHPRDLLRIADASPRESERARVPGLQALLEVLADDAG